jgi:hypothetical protein
MATHKGAAHHKKAAEHLELAAKQHREAAKHHEAGNHEKAAYHSELAAGHAHHAVYHTEEAAKQHAAEQVNRSVMRTVAVARDRQQFGRHSPTPSQRSPATLVTSVIHRFVLATLHRLSDARVGCFEKA